MEAKQIGLITILVLVLIIICCIAYGIYRLKRAVRSFSRKAFGTASLGKGIRRMEQEYVRTPKSVSAMTNMYLPKIKRDFPEFQYDEMKVRAENVLTSYLMAISAGNAGYLKEGSRELRDKLEMHISMLKRSGRRECFEQIKLHRTELSDYRKRDGRCIITFQTALQYQYSITDEKQENLVQAKFNTDAVYIQDRELTGDERDLALGINCPNCGAPVSALGNKICEYCGTAVVELNIYAWTFHNVSQAN